MPEIASAVTPDLGSQKLERVKVWIAVVLFVSFPILLVILLGALVFLFSVIHSRGGGQLVQSQPTAQVEAQQVDAPGLSTAEKMALAASVQVAIGMVMGFVSVFIGLMVTWFGISAAFEFGGKAEKGELSLKSASPGLLFFLGGIILIGVSLYKPITYEEPYRMTPIHLDGQQHKVDGIIIKPPPPVDRQEK